MTELQRAVAFLRELRRTPVDPAVQQALLRSLFPSIGLARIYAAASVVP